MKNKVVVSVFLLASILVGCDPREEEPSEPIRIGLSVWAGYGYVYVAEEKGFFEANNIDVELISYDDPAENYENYLNNDQEIMLDPISFAIMANVDGVPSKVVMQLDASDDGDALMAQPSITSFDDLRGKTISVEGLNSFSHIFIVTLLEKNGIKPGEYQLQNLAGSEVFSALEAGTIDAGHTWGVSLIESIDKGYTRLGKGGDLLGIESDVMIVHADFANEHPEEMRSILKALFEAREYSLANPEESHAIMARRLDMPVEAVTGSIMGIHQLDLAHNVEAMAKTNSTTSLFTVGGIIADFLYEGGQISVRPDLDAIIDPRFVRELAALEAQ